MTKNLLDHEISGGNLFGDAGVENADEQLLKARLVSRIQDRIDERELSQTEVAKLMGLAQPDLSEILRGRFRGYSVERLMRGLSSLGSDIEIVVRTCRPTSRSLPTRHTSPGRVRQHMTWGGDLGQSLEQSRLVP